MDATSLIPVGTFVVGLVASPLLDEWREARHRKQERVEAVAAVQRATIVEVQEVLCSHSFAFIRLQTILSVLHHHGPDTAKASEDRGKAVEEILDCTRRLTVLEGRILDANLRERIQATVSWTPEEPAEMNTISDASMNSYNELWTATLDRAGELYRDTWAASR